MASLLLNLIYSLTAELGSVVSHMQNYLGGLKIFDMAKTGVSGLFGQAGNLLNKALWTVYEYVMGFMDVLEYVINSFLGIGSTVDDYYQFAKDVNILDSYLKTFKAVCAVALVLMIIFTIFAIIRQEYVNATNRNPFSPDGNKKGPIIMRLFKGIMTMVILPIAVVVIIGGVNAVLTSFNRALKGDHDATISANVLSTASYNSNKFRLYAERDKRVPITIQAYNPDNYKPDEKSQLLYNIRSIETQNKLKATAQNLADNEFLSFKGSLTYSNNKFTNSSKYADYYENYICTPEQYQVLADFINYAELTQSDFYIRPMDDEFINWKYVNSAIYNEEDKSLTINYSDASDLNDNGYSDDTYSIVYSQNVDVSSPISDSLETIKALLGLDEYSDNVYNEMERQEGSVNVVQWANKKVSIHFSKNFVKDNPKTWTATDEIIMYEYYRFASNNTFANYTIDDFSWDNAITKGNPVLLDAYIYTYRKYYEIADAYSPEIDVDCVLINGNYYTTEVSEEETDEYGNAYYNLKELDGTNFLNSTYTTIFQCEADYVTNIKLSNGFDINNPNGWTYSDQIIVYEYYKDLSYNNEWSKYPFSKFSSGLSLPVYVISLHKNPDDINGTPAFYTLINGVYYQLKQNSTKSYSLYCPSDTTVDFMSQISNETSSSTSFYKYNILLNESYDSTNGISTAGNKTAEDFIFNDSTTGTYYYYTDSVTIDDGTNLVEKAKLKSATNLKDALEIDLFDGYETFDLKFSSTFDYKDVGTWNYKDYFIFYLYSKYLSKSGLTLDQLKINGGLKGEVCRVGDTKGTATANSNTLIEIAKYDKETGDEIEFETEGIKSYLYLFRIDENLTKDKDNATTDPVLYLKIDDILNISELNILNILDVTQTYENNNFDKAYEDTLFVDLSVGNAGSIKFSQGESENKRFSFSQYLNYGNVNSWTIGDFILFFLHEQGVINIDNSIDDNNFSNKEQILSEYSYNAEVYKFVESKVADSKRVFKFGDGTNILFLSEDYIINKCKFSTVDDWWETNLMNYISLKYITGSGNLISDNKSIADGIYASNFKPNVNSIKPFISELVQDYLFEISETDWVNYSTIATYSYMNSNFNEDDLSTWTVFDGIIYKIFGTVSRKNYTYSLAFKKGSSSDQCLIIGDYAILLSGTNISDLGLQLTNSYKLSATKSTYNISGGSSYTANGTNITNNSNFVVLNDYSTLIRYGNTTYSYKFADTSNGNQKLSNFDTFLMDLKANTTYGGYISYNLTSNATLNFELYKLNSGSAETYIKVGEKTDKSEAYFYKFNEYTSDSVLNFAESSSLLRCTKYLFEVQKDADEPENDFVYKSFELLNPENAGDPSKITILDLALYSITKSIQGSEYKVYNLKRLDGSNTGKQYIYINKVFLEYSDSQTEFINTADGVKAFAKDGSGNNVDNSVTITNLYNNYYRSYLISGASSTKENTIDMKKVEGIIGFDLNNVETWTPLTIMLYNLGAIDSTVTLDSSTNTLDGSYITEAYLLQNVDRGTSFLLLKKDREQATSRYYINITELFEISENKTTGDMIEIELSTIDELNDILFVNMVNMYKSDDVEDLKTLVGTSGQLNSLFSTYLSNKSICENKYTSQFSESNLSSWTWYDVLYYYYYGVAPSSTEMTYLEYAKTGDTTKYIQITNGYLTYYLKYNSNLFTKFSYKGQINTDFNLANSSINAFGVIYFSLTGYQTGKITQYELPDGTTIYYLNNSGINYYIYKLVNKTSNIATYDKVAVDQVKTGNLDVSDYSVLDFILESVSGRLKSGNNIILQYGVGSSAIYYLYVRNYYINLTALGVTIDLDHEKYVYNTTTNTSELQEKGKIITTTDKQLSTFIGYSGTVMGSGDSYNDTIKKYSLLKIVPESQRDDLENNSTFIPPIGTMDKDTGVVKLEFSDNFDMSDFSTWKLSDFIIYYIFTQSKVNFDQTEKNLQYYVNRGYIEATYCNITITDDFGNISSHNVLLIGQAKDVSDLDTVINKKKEGLKYLYVDYSIFYELYGKQLTNVYVLNYSATEAPLSLDLTGSVTDLAITSPTITKFGIILTSNIDTQDFKFEQNYYYDIDFDMIEAIFDFYKINEAPSLGTESAEPLIMNLKLSTDFNPNDPSTWTILDYIIIYEYTLNVNNNIFEELSYFDIKNVNYFVELQYDSKNLQAVLIVNSHKYNLSAFYNYADNTSLSIEAKLLDDSYRVIYNSAGEIFWFAEDIFDANVYTSENYTTLKSNYTPVFYKILDNYTQNVTYVEQNLYNEDNYKDDEGNIDTERYNIQGPSSSFSISDAIKVVNIAEENGYSIKLLANEIRYNINIQESDITEEFEDTWVDGSTYYEIKNKQTSEIIYVKSTEYSEDIYTEEFYEILNDSYIPASGAITQTEYLSNYKDYNSKPRVILNQTGQTLLYSSNVKVNWSSVSNPKIINEFYKLQNSKNNEFVFVKADELSSNYSAIVENVSYYKNGDTSTVYNVLEQPENVSSANSKDAKIKTYRNLDTNVYFNYQISLTRYSNYIISANVLKVNWPEKLMNDMMVIYSDLNWSNLLATDGWIGTLGDYHSGIATGQFITSGNSANISAVGMVLSEFLLSVATKTTGVNNYADYTYDSIFSDETVKALMLSMLGEMEYSKLQNEASVFVDLFNTSYAAILDDIAAERGINIKDGKVDSLEMSIYKSYLATALLSSDFAEYLYTIATRVLSQYTIYESLAKASGDYARYYAYFTGQTDENGEVVDAFSYSTFKELVQYENTSLRENAVPLFSFNYKTFLKKYLESVGISYYDDDYALYILVWDYIDNYYYTTYLINGNKISESDPTYCFMLDVYYSIRQDIKKSNSLQPTYLKLYKEFLDGKTTRWGEVQDSTINGASVYFEKYNNYKFKLQTTKTKVISSYVKNWIMPIYTLTDLIGDAANAYGSAIALEAELLTLDGEGAEDKANDIIDRFESIFEGMTNIQTVESILKKVFVNNPTYSSYLDSIYNKDNLFAAYFYSEDSELSQFLGGFSGKNYSSSWDYLSDTYNKLGDIISEISELTYLEAGQETNKCSVRYEGLSDDTIDEVYERLSTWYNNLGSYMSIQRILDSTAKASITFTLAQFANNYVEEGYRFTIQNKQYLLKTTVSTARLGEYVYGGSFLENFGIPATYTSSDFNGAVEISSGYDEKYDIVKSKIDSFTSLKEFASKIADYTGKLYLLSNFMELSANNSNITETESSGTNNEIVYNNKDSVLMTDYIYVTNQLVGNSGDIFSPTPYIKTTQEYLILDYMIQNKYLSMDTFYSLIVAEDASWSKLTALGLDRNQSRVGSFDHTSTTDDDKAKRLRNYLWYIQTTTIDPTSGDYGYYLGDKGYSGAYNVGDDTQSSRIHAVFKKVILYLTNSVEDTESGLDTSFEGTTISFKNMNFQKLKGILMDSLINYEKNDSESGDANTKRYLTIFYLICSEFNYYYSAGDYGDGTNSAATSEKGLGRTLMKVNNTLIREGADIVGYTSYNVGYTVRAAFKRDLPTSGLLLKLAGLENRPIEELVDRQYNNLYSKNGVYDEANGDVFIICTYNEFEGKYYPILMRNQNFDIYTGNFRQYLDEDFGANIKTKYYDSQYAYPIIAKGIMLGNETDLKPTAIRMVNGEITYYRDAVTATTELTEDSFTTGTIVSEVTTNNYVQYVPLSTFSGYGDSWAMYISANNPSLYLNSDMAVYYLQYRTTYELQPSDDYGAISIFNDFMSYYNMDTVFNLLMFLGFLTMIPIMVKALLVAMRRILDMLALLIVAPLAIAMNSLEIEENGVSKAYQTWKQMFTHSLLCVFGIVISLNLYYILVNTALNMTYIKEGDATMTIIAESPVSFLKASWLNAVITFIFVITASMMIESAANMLGSILTGQRVDNSFTSSISGTEPINDMTKYIKEVKGVFDTFGKIYSGEILLEAKSAALEKAKQMIPGSAVMRRMAGKMADNRAKKQANDFADMAEKAGMSKHEAQKQAFKLRKLSQDIRLEKHKQSLQRANSFNKTMGMEAFDDVHKGVKKVQDKPKASLMDVMKGAETKAKEGASNAIKKTAGAVKQGAKKIAEAVKDPKTAAKKIGQGIASGAKKVGHKVADGAKKVGTAIKEAPGKLGTAIKEAPGKMAEKIKNTNFVKNTQKVFKKMKEDPMGIVAGMFGKGAVLSHEARRNFKNSRKPNGTVQNSTPTGTPPTGGNPPAGGNPPTGGTPPTGGNPPTGGTPPTGGNPPAGGTPPAGGSPRVKRRNDTVGKKAKRAVLPLVSTPHLMKALFGKKKEKK